MKIPANYFATDSMMVYYDYCWIQINNQYNVYSETPTKAVHRGLSTVAYAATASSTWKYTPDSVCYFRRIECDSSSSRGVFVSLNEGVK